jgi:hypothetical protein
MKRGCGTRAGIFTVDDWDAADTHIAQYDLPADTFLAGHQAFHRVADDCGLDLLLVNSSAGKRGVHRIARDHFHAGIEILSKLHHAGADYRYFTHVKFSLMAGVARAEETIVHPEADGQVQ